MKGSNVLKAGILAGLILMIAIQAHGADPDRVYIRHIEGGVQLAEAGSSQWMEAAVNTPLIEGDTIRTATEGRAELFLKDGSVVRIGKGSIVKIVAVEQNGVQIKLERGMIYAVARGTKEVPVFIDTPSAALDVTTPATLRVDAYDGGISEISVYRGEVYAAQQKGKLPVRAGERLVLRMDGSAPVVAGLRSTDEWQRWNADRDRATLADYAASESSAYLPDELRTYSSDFDTNGQWVYTPEYNYVWVPTVITVSTWSPYRFGRWVWIRGSYVWVGYEPWGWAPYHYGRWAYHRHAGWCWVPPARGHVRWEPAHVAWVHSSRHVGWVPLAPGEAYDRRKAPVIHQTNVYNTYNSVTLERSVSTARTAYKNAGAANSVVTMERDSMLRAKAVNVNVAKTGAVPLKTVSLPAGVVPARAKNGPTGAIDRQKTTTGAPARPQPGNLPARGVTAPQATSVQPKGPSATTQKATAAPQGAPAAGVRDLSAGGQKPAAAPSLNTRIESARTKTTQPARQAPQGQSAPNAPVTVRSLAERIDNSRSSGAQKTAPAASPADLKRPANTGNTAGAAAQAAAPVRPQVQGRPAAVTARPVQGVGSPVQPARTVAPTAAGSGGQSTGATHAEESRQISKPNNAAVVNAPVRPQVQGRPSAPAAKPAQSVASPVQPAVRAPETSRQATPRTEQKPAAVQKDNPQPQAARQNPVKEKVDAPAPVKAPAAPAPAAVTPGKGDSPGNSKPAAMNSGRPQFQQNASMRR